MRKLLQRSRVVAACLACATWVFPMHALQAQSPSSADDSRPAILGDVRLDSAGTLRGKVVDGQGQPQRDQRLRLYRAGELLGELRTNPEGDFAFPRLRGGVYQLQLREVMVTCRVWTRAAAPPIAREQLLLVDAPEIARGQQPIGEIFTNPLFLGLLVAAAIAIPVAVHNSQQDPPPSS